MDILIKFARYNPIILGVVLVFVIFVGYKLYALTHENIRLDELHQSGYEEITVETEGQGVTPEKAEYDAKRLANSKIYGERVAGKTTTSMSSHNGERDRSMNEENISEFDSKFKSIIIIDTKRVEDEDGDKIWKVKIRATGVREINTR
jgi:hypothetical protein